VTDELPFPTAGTDVAGEFHRPPPGTTPAGVNVRGQDPRTLRLRGGSRAGLSKLIAAPVDGTVGHEVQHLNVIVDPTVDALLAEFEDWTDGGTPDPSTNNAADGDPDGPLARNPGRSVRPGGSGVQPTRRSRNTPPATGHRQSKVAEFEWIFGSATNGAGRTDTLAFDRPVLRKSLLVAAFCTINVAADVTTPVHTVSDSLGLHWTEAPDSWQGPLPALPAPSFPGALRLFWAYVTTRQASAPCAVSVATTVNRNPASSVLAADSPAVALAVLEYTGLEYAPGLTTVRDAGAIDHNAQFVAVTGLQTYTPGSPVRPSRAGGVVLGVFGAANGSGPLGARPVNAGPLDPTVTFTVRLESANRGLIVTEGVGSPATTAVTPELDVTLPGPGTFSYQWAALAASFRKGL
jgi:hypothetical protein